MYIYIKDSPCQTFSASDKKEQNLHVWEFRAFSKKLYLFV